MAAPVPTTYSPIQSRDNAWTDLVLTLPILLLYHTGVVFLPVRNAADWVTSLLMDLAQRSLFSYMLFTATVGAAVVVFFLVIGQKRALSAKRFALIAAEGTLYAIALRLVGSYVVGQLRLGTGPLENTSVFSGLVMSLGAGFYEELVFRVGLFAVLGHVVSLAVIASSKPWKKAIFWICWALFVAFFFSAWHHLGEFGEPFALKPFVFRWVSGLLFTLIFALRGFATAVWTHSLYDIWVMVL